MFGAGNKGVQGVRLKTRLDRLEARATVQPIERVEVWTQQRQGGRFYNVRGESMSEAALEASTAPCIVVYMVEGSE